MNRKFALFVALMLIVPLFGGVAAAQQNNTTATATAGPAATPTETPTATPTPTPTPTPSPTPTAEQREELGAGPYNITDLRKSGKSEGIENAESTRALGDPPSGFVAVRYRDPTLIDALTGGSGTWRHVEPDRKVQQDKIQVYGSAFGDVAGEYDLVIVYWQERTDQVDNRSVTYAANQTESRSSVVLDQQNLYTFQNVSLQSHTEDEWQVTMWMEKDGEKLNGVQWQFSHLSNPESASVDISSAAEAWGFALRNAVLPGIVSVIAGLVLAKMTLQKTGRGPGYGVSSWIFIVGFVSLIVSLIAYYQIAVVLSRLPWVMGVSIGIIAYTAGLTFHSPAKKIAFMRRELNDAITIPGGGGNAEPLEEITDGGAETFDEFTEALWMDLPEVPAVRTDEGYRVPVMGVVPFFARLFSDAAKLDMSNIATRQKVRNGRIDDIIVVDPDIEPALEHKPARLVRVLPIDTLGEDSTLGQEITAWALTGLMTIGPIAAGVWAMSAQFNLPIVGFFMGVTVAAILAYSAEDGWIEFEAAPPHFQRAEDSLTMLQRAYKNAKDEQEGKKAAWEERAKTAREAREERSEESKTVTDRILDSFGAGDTTGKDIEGNETKDD